MTQTTTKGFEFFLNYYNSILESKGLRLKTAVCLSEDHELKNLWPRYKEEEWTLVFHGKINGRMGADYLSFSLQEMRKNFPKSNIVLSTYDDPFSNAVIARNRETINDYVFCRDVGELPDPFGKSLCQQIETISCGLRLALQSKYAVKIRVDQRFTRGNGLSFMQFMIERLSSTASRKRIFTTSYNSYRNRPLGASDMIHFGLTESLIRFWKPISISEFLKTTKELQFKYSDLRWNDFSTPEVWLAARFMEEECEVDLIDLDFSNFIFWKELFGIVDSSMIGQEWLKAPIWASSNYATLPWFHRVMQPHYAELSFSDWVSNYFLAPVNSFPNVGFKLKPV